MVALILWELEMADVSAIAVGRDPFAALGQDGCGGCENLLLVTQSGH